MDVGILIAGVKIKQRRLNTGKSNKIGSSIKKKCNDKKIAALPSKKIILNLISKLETLTS